MKRALWAWALRQLQKRCVHPPQSVVADVFEGDFQTMRLRWCRCCGAYAINTSDFREPRPDWEK